jgi:UDP-glucose 4-epimerase
MAILITGGAGYIGSHMVLALTDAGEDVVVIDNLATGFEAAVSPKARFVRGDIGDPEALAAIFSAHKIDAIIHFAGSVVVPDSVADPLGYYFNNTVKSRALLEAAVKAGIGSFIFSSTAAVYGMAGAEPVSEAASLNPMSPYGKSKLMTEMMLADVAAAHDLRYVALRYFNVAGADPGGRVGQRTRGATHLVKVASEAALGKRPQLDVYGTDYPTADGSGVRDYIHVTDLVAAHRAALNHLVAGGKSMVLNCGYGHGYTVLQVVDAVRRVSGREFKVVLGPRRPGDPASVVADVAAIRRELAWKPQYDDLDTIVRTALAWEAKLNG